MDVHSSATLLSNIKREDNARKKWKAQFGHQFDIADSEDTDPRRLFTVDAVACVGCCSLAPVMMIEDETAGRLTPASARQVLDALEPRS